MLCVLRIKLLIVLKNKMIKVEEVVGMDVAMWAEETAEEMAEVK